MFPRRCQLNLHEDSVSKLSYVDVKSEDSGLQKETAVCALCYLPLSDVTKFPCTHAVCEACLSGKDRINWECPLCPFEDSAVSNVQVVIKRVKNLFVSAVAGLSNDANRSPYAFKCPTHPSNTVQFFCSICDKMICPMCKLSEHEGHPTQSLTLMSASAKESLPHATLRLKSYTQRLQTAKTVLTRHSQELDGERQEIEKQIIAAHAQLQSLIDGYRDNALLELDTLTFDVESHLSANAIRLDEELKVVSELQCRAESALHQEDPSVLVSTDLEIKKDWNPATLAARERKLVPSCTYHLDYASSCNVNAIKKFNRKPSQVLKTFEKHVKHFIGSATKIIKPVTSPGVEIKFAFSCCEEQDVYVHSVCPAGDGKVAVSFGPSSDFLNRPGCGTKSFFEDGRPSKSFDFGLCTLLKAGNGTFNYMSFNKQFLWNKYHILFCKSGKNYALTQFEDWCAIMSLPSPMFWRFRVPHVVMTIDRCAVQSLAFDVSSDGRVFAVIDCVHDKLKTLTDTPTRVVHVYSLHENHIAVVAYKSPTRSFLPSDVCFFNLQGREVLLVSDVTNDAIHVVHVDPGSNTCAFQAFLVCCSEQMHHPTSLNTDDRGRLWVGCRGGHLLNVEVPQ